MLGDEKEKPKGLGRGLGHDLEVIFLQRANLRFYLIIVYFEPVSGAR